MRELDLLRRQQREAAQHAAGIYRRGNLLTRADVANAGADWDVSRLPEATTGGDLQSAGGGWMFMVDRSVIDGPDLLG